MKCDKEKEEEGKDKKKGREGGWQRWEEEESHILPWIYSLVTHILRFSCAPLSFHSLESFLHAFLVPVLRLDRFTLASCCRSLNDNVVTHTSNSPNNPESRILAAFILTSAISLRNDTVCRMEFTRFQKFRTTWIFSRCSSEFQSLRISISIHRSICLYEFPTVGEFKFTFYFAWISKKIGGKIFLKILINEKRW